MNIFTILRRLVITIAHNMLIGQSSHVVVVGGSGSGSVISVEVNPAVVLAFHCSPSSSVNVAVDNMSPEKEVPCGGDRASHADLELVASAAEAFIHNSQIFKLGVGDSMIDGILDVSATALTPNSDHDLGNLRRSNDAQDDNNAILLSGLFHFRVPCNLPPSNLSIPSEYLISQLLHVAFVEEEASFIVSLRETTVNLSAENWLSRIAGCKTQIVGSGLQVNAHGRNLQNTNPGGVGNDSESSSSVNNVLLLVGAAGAAISLLLLCGGLCYAKKSFKIDDGSGGKKKSPSANGDVDATFQPGKNNPRTSGRLFKKKSSLGKSISQDGSDSPLSPPAPPPPPPRTIIGDDEESNADFLLARAALNHSVDEKPLEGMSVAGDSHALTYGDDMSYAFTVDGESLAPMGGNNHLSPGNNIDEDAAIGAGGLESFANDKGIFRWNEEGTKMVYTPTLLGKSENNEMNGFVFDKRKKKWVVKEQVIGEKSVSFQPNTNAARSSGGGLSQPISSSRIRSGDSAGTGMTGLTGMTDFSYDDVALDWAKRPRSNISDVSNIAEEEEDNSSRATKSSYSPSLSQEQGVEVSADDMSAFTGFTDFTANESPHWVTPERVSSIISDEATTSTFATGEPGRIVRKTPLSRPKNKLIAEETPFDEDETPFDELTRSRYGSKNSNSIPNMLDNLDSQSESGMSMGSANSEQVLDDLDKLSKFMMERKRSSKSQKGGASSKGGSRVSSFGSSSRNRKFSKH